MICQSMGPYGLLHGMSSLLSRCDTYVLMADGRFRGIVLQKSKVAGRRIFRENPKRESIADSYNLNRISEVACKFNVRR